MSNNLFTLDSLREETEKQFAPVRIGLSDGSEVVLSSVLRLAKDAREAAQSGLEDLNDLDDKDDSADNAELAIDAISKIFNAIADKPRELLEELKHDDSIVQVHLMTRVLNLWAKETQLGEA